MIESQRFERSLGRCRAFLEFVSPYFESFFSGMAYDLYDSCCGNGVAGYLFKCQANVSRLFLIDRKSLKLREKLQERLKDSFFFEKDIADFAFPEQDAAAIAIHACGGLTDIIIEKSVVSRIPFAVMPCCYDSSIRKYSLKNPPDPRRLMYSSREDYFDALRAQYCKENKFSVIAGSIDPKITPMNHVLVGLPKKL